MTKVGEIYKCEICGNVVEVKGAGAGALVCCGRPMELFVGDEFTENQEATKINKRDFEDTRSKPSVLTFPGAEK